MLLLDKWTLPTSVQNSLAFIQITSSTSERTLIRHQAYQNDQNLIPLYFRKHASVVRHSLICTSPPLEERVQEWVGGQIFVYFGEFFRLFAPQTILNLTRTVQRCEKNSLSFVYVSLNERKRVSLIVLTQNFLHFKTVWRRICEQAAHKGITAPYVVCYHFATAKVFYGESKVPIALISF